MMMINYDLYLKELEVFSQKLWSLKSGGSKGSEWEVTSI